MNINDEDVNLGLALHSANYRIRTRLNTSPGAGVNAYSRIDMAFAASDSLSELVWSPHNGLSLKCAHSSLANEKSFLLWNVGISSNVFSRSQSIRSKGTEDETAADQNSNIDIYDIMGLDVANCSETLATKVSDAFVCSLPNLNMNKTDMPLCIPPPPLKKLESSAENDLCNLIANEACSSGEIELRGEISPPVGRSLTKNKTCLYQEKGKEKALSDGDIYGRSLNDEDDSHDSVESRNSAGLFSKGIKRQRYDHDLILGSKRMKKQIRADSSFVNWISNMVKGLSDSKKEDSSSLASNQQENFMCNKTHDTASLNMGFQTMFQSLYCTKTNISSTGVSKEKDSIEFMLADEASPEIQRKQVDIAAEKTSPDTPLAMSSYVPEKSKHFTTSLWITRFSSRTPKLEKCNEFTEETNDYSTYCPKVNLDNQRSYEARDDSTDCQVYAFTANAEASVDLKSTSKLCHTLPCQKFPVCNIVVPSDEIFHAIKNLRLSRADILRWMNSDLSFSHLNGFFLRLRLGNLEDGVGEANYYVACITGDAREHNGCRSKKSVLVDVGGVKSSVGSQYVSNHDFLEDEIKAWWCRMVDNGCRIPSIDELNSKFNDGKRLGF